MKTKDELVQHCFSQFGRILNIYKETEKLARDFGTEDLLYPSEIHTIEAIGNNHKCSISELARMMGVTRAAIQKLSEKLHQKGYLRRFMSSDDNKRVYLELTEKGRIAHQGHHAFHKKMYNEIVSLINMFNKTELEKAITVFEAIEANFRSLLHPEENNNENSNM